MANRFWMSIKQAILNTSGFFSITSLQHKTHAQSRSQWRQPARTTFRSNLKGKSDFVHCRSFTTISREGRQFPCCLP